jgi:hypothetical protein
LKWIAGGVVFVLLATANAAGYRYGTSDQAFYIPAVVRAQQPDAFPRDAALIDAQARLMLYDEAFAAVVGTTGIPLPALFLAGYLLSLALIWSAALLIGRSTYGSVWLTLALGAALTLRHRIPRTSANSFEPYFHPRMLAFSLGALAVAALLRRRHWWAVALVGAAALVHVTTAAWFAVLLGVALMVVDPRWRRVALIGSAAAAVAAVWMMADGPLQAATVRMDPSWVEALSGKDSLFAGQWPVWAWVANLGLLVALWLAHRRRVAGGHATREEAGLVWGATAVVVLFLVTLPAVAARWALPVQLQIPRIFWLVDFLAIVYVIGTIERRRTAVGLAALLLAVSFARGSYVMAVEHPGRELFAVTYPATPWHEAMAWLRQQPRSVHVLADPGHAWRYGTSVRVSAERDVFVEDVKDSAIAIYSRDVAHRYTERMAALGDFATLTGDRARDLARRYDLDFVVTERHLDLPLVYSNEQFRIYAAR